MRRRLIQTVLPLVFCAVPLLVAALIASSLPATARNFYLAHVTPLDLFILGLGSFLFVVQVLFAWRALQWRGTGFDEGPDRWLSNLHRVVNPPAGEGRPRLSIAFFNHPNYDAPANLNLGTSGFAQITNLQTAEGSGPRAIQLTARLNF